MSSEVAMLEISAQGSSRHLDSKSAADPLTEYKGALIYVDILDNQQKLLVHTITAETWYCEPGKCLFFENKRCQVAHQQ